MELTAILKTENLNIGYTSKKGNLEIQVVDFSGRNVKTFKANSTTNGIELNLPKKGNYLLKVENEVVKFVY